MAALSWDKLLPMEYVQTTSPQGGLDIVHWHFVPCLLNSNLQGVDPVLGMLTNLLLNKDSVSKWDKSGELSRLSLSNLLSLIPEETKCFLILALNLVLRYFLTTFLKVCSLTGTL